MNSEEEPATVVAEPTPRVGDKGDAASKEFAPPAVAAPLDGEASRVQSSSRETAEDTRFYQPCKLFYGLEILAQGTVCLDLVFMHGLQPLFDRDAGKSAWTNRNGIFWPLDWLPKALELVLKGRTLRVYGVNYNAQASGYFAGDMGVAGAGHKRTVMNLFHSAVVGGKRLGRTPFVVIAHSYGGIVLKSLVVYCEKLSKECKANKTRLEIEEIDAAIAFMANFRGYVFYGVPQMGSYHAFIARFFTIVLRLGENVKDLTPLNAGTVEVLRDFDRITRDRGILRFAFGETVPIKWFLLKLMVVSPESAQALHYDSEYMDLVSEDHISMTKPNSRDAVSFQKLVGFLKEIIEALPLPKADTGDEFIAALGSLPDSGYARKPQFKIYARIEDFTEPSMPVADFFVKVLSIFKLIHDEC